MKMKRYLSVLLCAVLVCTLLAGCGSSSKTQSMASYDAPVEMAAAESPAAANGAALRDSGTSGSTALPENRKWIVTVYMSAETEDLDAMTKDLDARIQEMGGYVEDQNVHNGSAYGGRRYRYANLTIRIPAERVDSFTQEIAGLSNVVSKSKKLEDVTLSYVATESRVNGLKTEEARLLELMAQAETMSDLLEIEGRLTEVRYELENYASRLRLYDNQIDYATIHLDIEEVQEYTPAEEPSLWDRIRTGFGDSLEALGDSVQDLLVFLVAALPFLVVYGGIALVLLLLTRGLRRRAKQRRLTSKEKKLSRKLDVPEDILPTASHPAEDLDKPQDTPAEE